MKKGLVVTGCMLSVFAQVCWSQVTNIALHKPVIVSSAAAGAPGGNITDGIISRTSKWEAGNGRAPHIVEIDLQHYYTISQVKVHSGIMDSEKKPDEMTQAAGFWSIKNFKLQYWDDANWSDFPGSEVHENRLTTAAFDFAPAITTARFRLVCDDGEPINIMEIEAFGALTPNMPTPPGITQPMDPRQTNSGTQSATITVKPVVTGRSLKYVGYNQGYYMPGSNVSAWVEYSQVNSFRVWATMNAFVPETSVQVDKNLQSVAEFDQRKKELRTNPENNRFIKWKDLLPLYNRPDSSSTNAMVFNYALSELKRLKVDVVLQMGSTDFNESWENKWKQWQRYYALAYHAARQGDVSMFAMQNEPNHRNSGPMKLDQWIGGMQVVSDAIHAAVDDVNKKYGKHLVAKFVGPVTAGQNTEWWAGVSKAIRTDYHGRTIDHDLLQIFATHSYNSPAVGYESRINNIRNIIVDNHPAHQSLPIAYTEIGRWMNAYLIDKAETMDSPSLFTEWAGIYANNMKNGGYGMWAFKFANTASAGYPRGIKSGHHFIWQGKRIVEDAYKNLAFRKHVTASTALNADLITDGDKSDQSAWIADTLNTEKWAEIDLGERMALGSAVIYSGSDGGVYTAPDRIKTFSLQYFSNDGWKDIEGTVEKQNKYAQVFSIFKMPVTTDKVRFVTNDKGSVKLREIKLFAANDGPSKASNFDVSGIQRTGEVVRLFAKGFKNQRPVYETLASVKDAALDACTSYDSISGNYYLWLVQRGGFDYKLKLDLSGLPVSPGALITTETVSPVWYGEVTSTSTLGINKAINLQLPAQSVQLLTVSTKKLKAVTVAARAAVTVARGNLTMQKNNLEVALDAGVPANNRVSYIDFKLAAQSIKPADRIVLEVTGKVLDAKGPFRLHVYAIPNAAWNAAGMNWNNAPLLDRKEAWLHGVGSKAFVAGELAFNDSLQVHALDVTDLLKRHATTGVTFVLIRETRQLGDDEDKGRKVSVQGLGSNAPRLVFYNR